MSFGIDSDILGFSDTTNSISLQSVTNPVKEASEAQAMDSNGDVAASTLYDTGAGHSITLNYVLGKDTTVLLYDTTTSVDVRGGKVVNGYVITGVSATTSNTDFAKISLTAQKTNAVDGDVAKYVWGFTVTGGKGAVPYGFSSDTATRVTGSSVTGSLSVARAMDSTGEELCADVSTGRLEASNDLVGVTGAPGGSADTGWTLISGSSKSEGNTAYATGSATVFKNITAS
jgi:hypothetical protein